MPAFRDSILSLPGQLARELAQDVKHAWRVWAKYPAQAALAVLALAIGIGANAGVFSVVNALLLRSLPFRDPARLAATHSYLVPHDSAEQFHGWREHSLYLSDAATFEEIDFNLGRAGALERAHVAQTSWNFFSLLGLHPALGRTFGPGEDTPGRDDIAVISYGLWQQLFAGDQRALGAAIRMNGDPLTVIGVAPPGFDFPNHTALWKAARFTPGNNGWQTIARLRSGITWMQARAAFRAEIDRLAIENQASRTSGDDVALTSLQDDLAGPAKTASLLLLAAVILILLIACTNIANLLLARTADRAVELAIRTALGASRMRLMRQLLAECMLFSVAAAIAGSAVALWTTSIAAKTQPAALATQAYSLLDVRVLGFTVGVSIASALLFGFLPALHAGRGHIFEARGSNRTRGSRVTSQMLVAAQVTLTIVLLTASFSLGRAFVRLVQTDRGFRTQGLITVAVSLDGTNRAEPPRRLAYFEDTLDRIRHLPGVQSASETDSLPLYATGFVGGLFTLDGRPAARTTMLVRVLPDYFRTMNDPMLAGRDFTEAEIRSDAKVAVAGERLARRLGRPADAIGHLVAIGSDPPWKIIGVVNNMDYMTPGANSLELFVPAHEPGDFFSSFVVRVGGRAEDSVALVRDAVRSIDKQVPVFGAKTMEQRLADTLARPRFYRTALLSFAGFALLLSVLGMHGVVSYAVARRTREMGIRLALGTTPNRLRGTLLGQGLLPVGAGAICGITATFLSARFLEHLVAGAASAEFGSLAAAAFCLALLAALSIWNATRRISALEVAAILRVE